jgi:hypothetical protein
MGQEPVILKRQALEVLKKSTKMLETADRLRLQGREEEAYRLRGEARALGSNTALIMARAGQPLHTTSENSTRVLPSRGVCYDR